LLLAFQTFAAKQGWAGLEIVPPPAIYRADGSDTVDFALAACGFTPAARWLCHAITLIPGTDLFAGLFRGKNARRARAALKASVQTAIGGIELIDGFRAVFDETYTRHGVKATHSLDEIQDLMRRLPDRFQFAVATHDGAPLGALFIMNMNRGVANAFYICNSAERPELNAGLAMFATTLDHLARQGFQILDLGPSSDDRGQISPGVAYFKESLGAVGYCRDRWVWSAA
jgi:hypothetical protein